MNEDKHLVLATGDELEIQHEEGKSQTLTPASRKSRMSSEELNAKLHDLNDDVIKNAVPELEGSGKVVPYYGWFWRDVNFDMTITFAYGSGEGFDVPGWVGFCKNNKWNYPEFYATVEQSLTVRLLCETLVEQKTPDAARALFRYIQSLKPTEERSEERSEEQ